MALTLIDNKGGRRQVSGKVAEIVLWLLDQADHVEKADKCQIQADIAGESMTLRCQQITERGRRQQR